MAVESPAPAAAARIDRLERIWAERPGLTGWLTTTDHKRIALLYLATSLAFFAAGGAEALVMRTQLAQPNERVIGPATYDQLMTMHGVTMIFFFVIPLSIGAFGNYLVPLMIGARDMAFPRMNALSFWVFLASGIFMYTGLAVGQSPDAGWQTLRWLVAGSVALVYVSFSFVLEPPQAHSFYVLAPVAFMFAAYCWTFVDSPGWRRIAGAILAANIAFHIGQAWIQAPEKSIFRNREVVAAAIRTKQPQLFAHRRAFAIDGGPSSLQDPSRPYDALRDVQFTNTRLTMGPRSVALWSITLRIANPRVAFRDVLYQTQYRDANGQVILQRHERIKDIFQPGVVATLEVNDGRVTTPFASATIEVLAAEALLPLE